MSSSLLITLEMAGVLGVVIVFGLWELWTLRRDKAQHKVSDLSQLAQDADAPVGGQAADKQPSFPAK